MMFEVTGELQTVLTRSALAAADRAYLRISGPDATRWLNGMVTNSVQALQPGEGNYHFVLNAQGRIQADCMIYRSDGGSQAEFLLETDPGQAAALADLLDRFIIMDDVELVPLDDLGHGLMLAGPEARSLLAGLPDAMALAPSLPWATARLGSMAAGRVQVTSPALGIVPRFLLMATDGFILEELAAAFATRGVPTLSAETVEQLRVLEAQPRYGTDIRNQERAKDLPQEANQPHALHFAKGCYVGQEIVERIRSRGQVHRLLTPFRLTGELPHSLPASLEANGKAAGEITSALAVMSAEGAVQIGLGYARREAMDSGAVLHYAGGEAVPRRAGSLT